ncbi:tetratricopeptide repeat protein [Flavobacterium enshiense]|uniref:tetratricopeptide repeat protein n=1 Tax=Flavobacterium enshiense TaxID=1341165 RepID=UPI00345C7BB4
MRHTIITIVIITLFLYSCNFKTAPEYLVEAEKLEGEGKYKEAILLLDKAILKDKKFVDAYINRGVDKSALGEYEKAIEDYKKVIELNPKNTMAFFNLGNNFKQIGDYKKAAEFYNRAFDTKGGDRFYGDLSENNFVELGYEYDVPGKMIHYERGVSNVYLNDLEKANFDFQACIQQNYKTAESYYWIGQIYLLRGQKKLACENFYKSEKLGEKLAKAEIEKNCNN